LQKIKKKNFFNYFFIFLDHFDLLMSKKKFKNKKHYFNVCLIEKHFENQLLAQCQTSSKNKRHGIISYNFRFKMGKLLIKHLVVLLITGNSQYMITCCSWINIWMKNFENTNTRQGLISIDTILSI